MSAGSPLEEEERDICTIIIPNCCTFVKGVWGVYHQRYYIAYTHHVVSTWRMICAGLLYADTYADPLKAGLLENITTRVTCDTKDRPGTRTIIEKIYTSTARVYTYTAKVLPTTDNTYIPGTRYETTLTLYELTGENKNFPLHEYVPQTLILYTLRL